MPSGGIADGGVPLPHGVGLRTYMLAAVVIFGTLVAVIGLFGLLLNLD